MKKTLESVNRFLLAEDGPTAVEYAFLTGFIIAVCVTAIGSLGQSTDAYFRRTKNSMS